MSPYGYIWEGRDGDLWLSPFGYTKNTKGKYMKLKNIDDPGKSFPHTDASICNWRAISAVHSHHNSR